MNNQNETPSESPRYTPPPPEGYTYRGTKLSELGDVDHKDVAVWHRGWLQGWVTDLSGPLEAQRGLHYAVRTSESPGSTQVDMIHVKYWASVDRSRLTPNPLHDKPITNAFGEVCPDQYEFVIWKKSPPENPIRVDRKILEKLARGARNWWGSGDATYRAAKDALEANPAETDDLERRCRNLEAALKGVLDRYVGLANSGDAGYWDCEQEDEVIAAREALAQGSGGGEG